MRYLEQLFIMIATVSSNIFPTNVNHEHI